MALSTMSISQSQLFLESVMIRLPVLYRKALYIYNIINTNRGRDAHMMRRFISLVIAISMLSAAFIAVGVVGQDLTGSLVTKNSDNDSETLFLDNEIMHFTVTFQVDGNPQAADFTVELRNYGGSLLNDRSITTDSNGVYNSWGNGTNFWLGGLDGTYRVNAMLDSTGQILFTKIITVKDIDIEITDPTDRWTYVPGETIEILVIVDVSPYATDTINITIQGSESNHTWNDQSLTDYEWTGTWDIPSDIETGSFDIVVNSTDGNATIRTESISIQYFDFMLWADRNVYLPGDDAIFSWMAYTIPDYDPINVTIDLNISYISGIDGTTKWINASDIASQPYTVTLPTIADIDAWPGVIAYAKAYADSGENRTSESTLWIDIDDLSASVNADLSDYLPGENIVVDVTATVGTGRLPGATVNVEVDDGTGVLIAGLSLSNLTTDANGETGGIIEIPTDMETGNYRVIATVTKGDYTVVVSDNIWVIEDWVVDLTTDKSSYLSGETITATLEILKDGQSVAADNIYYILVSASRGLLATPSYTSSMSIPIDVPSGIEVNDASISMMVTVGEDVFYPSSNQFTISNAIITLGVSQREYRAGDSIDFSVMVQGDVSLDVTYKILDNDGSTVQTGNLTLDSDNEASFTLDVPEDTPSQSYTAQVIGDDGDGYIIVADRTVNLESDYIVDFWIKSGPAYASGYYAPGQKIVIGFEIIPQGDLPDMSSVTARLMINPIGYLGPIQNFDAMTGEMEITLPDNLPNGEYTIQLTIDGVGTSSSKIEVNANMSSWDRSLGGISAASLALLILLIIVILMLAVMMMRGVKGAAAGEPKPKPPKEEKKKPEEYKPKATVDCPSCGTPIEVGTSKRPIEVMCPKCGASQMVK